MNICSYIDDCFTFQDIETLFRKTEVLEMSHFFRDLFRLGTSGHHGHGHHGVHNAPIQPPASYPSPAKPESTQLCPNCLQENDKSHKFCINCGTNLQSLLIVCPECNASVLKNAVFCPSCGYKLQK